MEALLATYPEVGRPMARRLAQLTDSAMESLGESILKKGTEELNRILSVYELGVCFRAVRISSGRIEKIVTGLRNYGRQSTSGWLEASLVDGIRDTLTVLNNRLRQYDLKLDLQEVEPFNCNLGEINQVWTNLLVNAMDATDQSGCIRIESKCENGEIVVCIEDSGTGIPSEKLESIFEPNYTTKNQSGSYGLGLGLSISREIVEKHGGSLRARNGSNGGAILETRFPLG